MPKKYNNRAQYTKPASTVHPSLASSAPSHNGESSTSGSSASVSDLINHLRRSQVPSAAESANLEVNLAPTVHPSLKALLNIPDTQPPPPRMQTNSRRRTRGPAGPPPPKSWLADSVYAPRHLQRFELGTSTSSEIQPRLGRLPGTFLPTCSQRSLLHQTLRAIAEHWQWHIDYDQYYLATLPDRYKEILLSYISVYHFFGVTLLGLQTLFLDDSELEDATGSSTITHLDLTSALGPSLTSRELVSFFDKPAPTTTSSSLVPDSWDDSPPRTPTSTSSFNSPVPTIPTNPTIPRFPCLTHLSLSNPSILCPDPWSALLALLPHLKTITHLSISHFPIPCLNPNSAATTTTSIVGQVPGGATAFYEHDPDDGDWSEAVTVLRRLGKRTLCLKWLEMDGCAEWIEALAWEDPDRTRRRDGSEYGDFGGKSPTSINEAPASRPHGGIDWNGCWRGVETVRVTVGWMPEGILDKRLYGEAARKSGRSAEEQRKLYARKMVALRWVQEQKKVKRVEERVAKVRRSRGNKPVRFERGDWGQEVEKVVEAGVAEIEYQSRSWEEVRW